MRQHLSALLVAVFILTFTTRAHGQMIISTIAGTPDNTGYSGDGGPATDALLYGPSDVALDHNGNLYIADFINNVVRKIDTGGIISTIAGTGYGAGGTATGGYTGDNGPATMAELNGPFGLAIDQSGNVFFADGYNHIVRKVSTSGIITTVAGNHTAGYAGDNGPATAASLNNPVGLAFDKDGNLYIADDHNSVIRKMDNTGIITTFAGNHVTGYSGDGGPATAASLGDPIGVAADTAGNIYIADTANVIRKVGTDGMISTFAGNGTPGYTGDGEAATAAQLNSPERVTVDDSNNVYISDFYNNVVRKVNTAGVISTVAGDGTGAGSPPSAAYGGDGYAATLAQLYLPEGVAVAPSGVIYISDRGNDIIRRVGPVITDNTGVSPVQNSQEGELTVYPNPNNTGYLTFKLAAANTERVTATIVNVLGETVSSIIATTNKTGIIKLDQSPGVYFLNVVTTHGNQIKQIIIE